MVVAGCGSVGATSSPSARGAGSSRRSHARALQRPTCPRSVRGQGMIALAARGQVKLVDLATCRSRVLADVNAIDVRFSHDGRWLAYSRQAGYPGTASTVSAGLFVVSVRGGPEHSPLGTGVIAWSWSPTHDVLYGITTGGSLVSASPTGDRRVIAAHLGSGRDAPSALSISPDGRRAVIDRSRCSPATVGELDTIDLRTGARSVTLTQPGRYLTLAGWSPNGRWLLFWPQSQCSASLAADGMPLQAVRAGGGRPVTAIRHMLLYTNYLSWCGRRRLVAAAGPDRQSNVGSELLQTGPPSWHQRTIDSARTLSWVSPACAPSGHVLAAAAGISNAGLAAFGQEHRSIWLLRPDGLPIRQLSDPPSRGLTDEAPRFSRNGHWILFVSTHNHLPRPAAGPSTSNDTVELTPADGKGSAIPVARFTSDDVSYYDHFDWPREIDWYQRAAAILGR